MRIPAMQGIGQSALRFTVLRVKPGKFGLSRKRFFAVFCRPDACPGLARTAPARVAGKPCRPASAASFAESCAASMRARRRPLPM
jgi:hypothetical protein